MDIGGKEEERDIPSPKKENSRRTPATNKSDFVVYFTLL
jgi:hypothetical protein